jgi:hypothetical protein
MRTLEARSKDLAGAADLKVFCLNIEVLGNHTPSSAVYILD